MKKEIKKLGKLTLKKETLSRLSEKETAALKGGKLMFFTITFVCQSRFCGPTEATILYA